MGIYANRGRLSLFDDYGAFFADFHTAFAAEAFFGVDCHRFVILHFENFHRTNIHALFATYALFLINDRVKGHFNVSFLINIALVYGTQTNFSSIGKKSLHELARRVKPSGSFFSVCPVGI